MQIDPIVSQSKMGSPTLTVYAPLPAEHPIYAAIGRAVSAAASFEHHLDKLIWKLIGLRNERASAITSQMMGALPRLNALIALCHERNWDDIVGQLRKLGGKCQGPYDKRNRVVHDAWLLDPDSNGAKQLRTMPRANLQYGLQDVNDADLAAIVEDFGKLTMVAVNIMREVRSRL